MWPWKSQKIYSITVIALRGARHTTSPMQIQFSACKFRPIAPLELSGTQIPPPPPELIQLNRCVKRFREDLVYTLYPHLPPILVWRTTRARLWLSESARVYRESLRAPSIFLLVLHLSLSTFSCLQYIYLSSKHQQRVEFWDIGLNLRANVRSNLISRLSLISTPNLGMKLNSIVVRLWYKAGS